MQISRRRFVQFAAVAAVLQPSFIRAEPVSYADPEAAASWIDAWIKSSRTANDPLYLGRFADPIYFLRSPITWSPNPGQDVPQATVPSGFVTDFASIPRVFWSLLPPDGTYTYAAIIHDYLYWSQAGTRADADLVLKYAMEEFNVNAAAVAAIYSGVRVGGQFAWDDNRSRRTSGEKRILKLFPEDPKVTWAQWQKRADAF